MSDSRINAVNERFRTLLKRWLAALPANGWEGTSKELGDALYAFGRQHRLYAAVGVSMGTVLERWGEVLAAEGFTLTTRRTKKARLVRVERTK